MKLDSNPLKRKELVMEVNVSLFTMALLTINLKLVEIYHMTSLLFSG